MDIPNFSRRMFDVAKQNWGFIPLLVWSLFLYLISGMADDLIVRIFWLGLMALMASGSLITRILWKEPDDGEAEQNART